MTNSNGTSMWEWQIVSSHRSSTSTSRPLPTNPTARIPAARNKADPSGKWVRTKVGDLAFVVSVRLPIAPMNKAITRNRAILITTALITAILAMVVAYAIVRYVIVKPVKHLRDVSDAIAAGKLTVRAQIQTGDEFEELAHAFNRMLHNLVAMQQELRDVNNDLDRKIDEGWLTGQYGPLLR